jgi:hypothetical protein
MFMIFTVFDFFSINLRVPPQLLQLIPAIVRLIIILSKSNNAIAAASIYQKINEIKKMG